MPENPNPVDVPSPIDFFDPAQALEWVNQTVKLRPWRPMFFDAFARELEQRFSDTYTVAELGSGPGHLARVLLQSKKIETYIAVDFSPAMHDLAKAHLGDARERAKFLLQDFRAQDWSKNIGPVDAIVTMQAAHEVRHRSRLPALLREAYAAIRPGGLLLFCDHYVGPNNERNRDLYLSRLEQAEMLKSAGFANVGLCLDAGEMALYSATRL